MTEIIKPKDCIGIDLGTTNSVIAYFNPETESVEILANLIGERLTPSIIRYLPNEILIGKTASDSRGTSNEEELEQYPIISHVKRFIGRKYSPIKDVIETLDYQVIADHQDFPLIPVADKKYKPEEVSAQILKYLKESAEQYLGRPITQAVVTIPAYFNESQRRATHNACTLAGLDCLRLVAEPTSACLCYGLHKSNEETVLVYDLGGGTLDVSILQLHDGIFEVIGTSGNTLLGGADLDHMLVIYLKEKCLESTGIQIEISQEIAENIKKTLSNRSQTTVRIGDFKYIITRAEFEELAHDFIEECMKPVESVLTDAKMTCADISQIVLVGGSTRVPIIQETLSKWFNGKPLNKSINPDEAVAYGAAIQASIIQKVGSKAKSMLLIDVNPLSLGIETTGGIMNNIIGRNSALPCEASKIFSTVDDNQESVDIKVFQGERQFTKDNIKLGVFTLEGLPRAPRGVPKIQVKFKMNCDGLLEVSAVDKNTGLASSIIINSENNMSDVEVKKILDEAELFKIKDYNQKQAIEELNRFEKYIYEMQRQANLPEMQDCLGKDGLSPLNQYLINTIDWIVSQRNVSDLETIQNCRREVEFRLKPYLDKMYSHRDQLQQSGIKIQSEKAPSVEHINDLINNLCQDLL